MTVRGDQSETQRNRDYEERVVLDTRPCYVKYSLRGLGAFSGGLCLVFAILNLLFHPLHFVCILFSIIQGVIGFLVATSEAAGGSVRICYCIFLNKFPTCSDWIDQQPLWVKPLCYILIPLPGMLACTTVWTVFGGGMVLLTGVAYTISLWKQQPPSHQNTSSTNENNNPTTTNTTTNNPTLSNNVLFPKHTVNNWDSPPTTTQPSRPTIIDIRQNNATTPKAGKTSPMNPLASLSKYDAATTSSKGANYYESESKSNDRYENISVISGQTRNTPNTTEMEMNPRVPSRSYYGNVVDLDDEGVGDTSVAVDGYGGAYPDNPFVVATNPRKNNEIRSQRKNYDEDEYNC